MKQTIKQSIIFLFIIMLFLPIPSRTLVTHFKIRPQSLNGARKVAGESFIYNHLKSIKPWSDYDPYLLGEFPDNICQEYLPTIMLSTAFEYQHSFNPNAISESLFGNLLQSTKKCSSRSLKIQGSFIENRDPNALRADDFYLSDEYDSSISFKPTISNLIVDFNCYVNLDSILNGMYFRIYAPFVHTRWNLHARETINGTTDNPDQAVEGGRFSPDFLTSENILSSALDFFSGKQVNDVLDPEQTSVVGTDPRAPYSLTRHPLSFHTFNKCANTKNGFGEIRTELGWNFIQDSYHLGVYLAGAAPTSNHVSAQKLFAPSVGNGKHGELGGGITGHYLFWQSNNEEHHVGIYADMLVTHLFNAQEQRVFDLKNKPLSRYMLASKHIPANGGPNNVGGFLVDGQFPTLIPFLSAHEFTPVANLTAQQVKVSIGAQVDLTTWLHCTMNGFTMDLGYNLWLQTGEKIACSSTCGPRLSNETDTWVLHGTSELFGYFFPNSSPALSASQGTIIAASQSQATITTAADPDTRNISVDNAHLVNALPHVFQPPTELPLNHFSNKNNGFSAANQIRASSPPLFLSTAHIDKTVQTKTALSHKIFGNVSYTMDLAYIMPFFGIGGEAEFGTKSGSCNNNVATLSQWGVWTKIGITF